MRNEEQKVDLYKRLGINPDLLRRAADIWQDRDPARATRLRILERAIREAK